jgi:hypothetical protein
MNSVLNTVEEPWNASVCRPTARPLAVRYTKLDSEVIIRDATWPLKILMMAPTRLFALYNAAFNHRLCDLLAISTTCRLGWSARRLSLASDIPSWHWETACGHSSFFMAMISAKGLHSKTAFVAGRTRTTLPDALLMRKSGFFSSPDAWLWPTAS